LVLAEAVLLVASVVEVELLESVVSVWLIEISCSRLFTFTNWLMYSLGSVFAVGSWFFISVTNRVRKSLAEMVDESLLVLLVLLVVASALAVVLLEVAAAGAATLAERACAAVMW